MRAGQTHMQRYMKKLLAIIEEGKSIPPLLLRIASRSTMLPKRTKRFAIKKMVASKLSSSLHLRRPHLEGRL